MVERLSLPRALSSPAAARGVVRETLRRFGAPEEQVETAQLVASELVANAVQHAGSEVELLLRIEKNRLRVEVLDYGGGMPVKQAPPPDADRGRGLLMVEALSDDWGVVSEEQRKAVWAEVPVRMAASVGFGQPA